MYKSSATFRMSDPCAEISTHGLVQLNSIQRHWRPLARWLSVGANYLSLPPITFKAIIKEYDCAKSIEKSGSIPSECALHLAF